MPPRPLTGKAQMKIVLIDPPVSHAQLYGDWDLSALETRCPPLGLLSLAAFVRAHGHEARILDLVSQPQSVEDVVGFVAAEAPRAVGLSARTINVHGAARLAERLRAAGFEGPVVVGGPHVTAVPVATLERFPSFDYGVTGEGEVTLLELLERIAAGVPPDDVRGVVWRDPAGQVRRNATRPLLADLDELPMPAWDLLPDFPHGYPHSVLETRRLPTASLMTSRGCPYQCTFCDSLVFGHSVRTHSAGYTLDMIRFLRKRYGIRDLMMLDDNFILRQERLFEICDTMVRERMDLQWYCMGHARTMTPERLRKIREAGCWIVEMGIESGCDRILRTIRKSATRDEVAVAVRRARAAGLKVKGNFIFGLPTETRESLEETIRFATGIGLSYFQQNFLTVWPGCELSAEPGRYGDVETDWERLAHQRVTFVPTGLTEADLLRASKQAFRRFYLRPRIVLELLPLLTSWRGVQALAAGFVGFLRTMVRRGGAPHPAR
jgi:radical SAM superfamily enzyme YgiQ (UPF0313 family)